MQIKVLLRLFLSSFLRTGEQISRVLANCGGAENYRCCSTAVNSKKKKKKIGVSEKILLFSELTPGINQQFGSARSLSASLWPENSKWQRMSEKLFNCGGC